jgi:hypothetical protein
VAEDIRRFPLVGKLHADSQQLGRKLVALLSGQGPVPAEDVKARLVPVTAELVIRCGGDRFDPEFKPGRVSIQVDNLNHGCR